MPRQHEVLVIDQEPTICEGLRDVLADAGYAVQTVPDTAAGLRVLRTHHDPMVVLFDVEPLAPLTRVENGLGLLDAVEQDTGLEHNGFIMMSTAPEQALVRAGVLPPHVNVTMVREPLDRDYLLCAVAAAAQRAAEQAVGSAVE
jgi:CheY-like chemotaxis protein